MEKPFTAEHIAAVLRGEFVPCEAFHPSSCEVNALRRFISVFKLAIKVYAPVHLAPLVLFKLKALLKDPVHHLQRVLLSIGRSCSFIAMFGFLAKYFLCRFGRLFGYRALTWVLAVMMGSLSVGLETPSRRTELALYLLPRAVEAGWNMTVQRGWMRNLPLGEVLLFALSMSVMMGFYQTDATNIKQTYRSIFKVVFGEN